MSDHSRQVFQTNNAKRYKVTKWTLRTVGSILLFILMVVSVAVARGKNPSMPQIKSIEKLFKSKLNPDNKFTLSTPLNRNFKGFKDFLQKKILAEKSSNNVVNTQLIRGAFYVPWSPLSLYDLRTNGSKLNTIYPEWFFINPKTFRLDSRIDKEALGVMKSHHLSIQPIFNNFISVPGQQGNFSGDLLHTVLHDDKIQNKLIAQIITTLKANNLQGINIDFEEMKEN